jgi:hypothetical protein
MRRGCPIRRPAATGLDLLQRVALGPATTLWKHRAMKIKTALAVLLLAPMAHAASRDGQHDFDFHIGNWKTHVSRLQHPLTGSTTWVEYDGTTVVSKVWNGRANLVELEVDGSAGHLELLSLRLYNPETHLWSLNVAGSGGGELGVPTVGEFKNGRGEFFDHETFNGRTILVRFTIFDIEAKSIRFEQAFSADEGKTWEVNWRATDTRVSE